MAEEENTREQRDVLARKDRVLKSGLGLQIWGSREGGESDAPGGDAGGGHGNASMGTAERQARVGHMASEAEAGSGDAQDDPSA